jgi:hypothetical protein
MQAGVVQVLVTSQASTCSGGHRLEQLVGPQRSGHRHEVPGAGSPHTVSAA